MTPQPPVELPPAGAGHAGETPALPGGGLVRLLLESVGVFWLAIVAAQYALKMLLVSLPPSADLSSAYLPLLASALIAGIIGYRFCRLEEPAGPSRPAAPEPSGPASAPRENASSDESLE